MSVKGPFRTKSNVPVTSASPPIADPWRTSPARQVRANRAGIVADNPKGKNTAEQTSSILSQIDDFLATAGTNKTKLLSAKTWVTNTPARATVEALTQKAFNHLLQQTLP